jgi:hypothetical protein
LGVGLREVVEEEGHLLTNGAIMKAMQQPIGTKARRIGRIYSACGIAIIVALISVINPAAGYAAAKPPKVKLGSSTTAICSEISCPGPSRGNDIVAKVNLGQDFTKAGRQVTQVCLNFTFDEANPLDPGEELDVASDDSGALFGMVKVGTEPQFSRTICTLDNLNNFQDGEVTLDVYAGIGSFTLADLTVTYTTSPIN